MVSWLKNRRELVFLLVLVVLTQASLWRPGWWENHDPAAVLRLKAFEECLQDGQIPCRWTTLFGGGFGLPLFSFYPPLFYALSYVWRLVGFSLSTSLKLTLFGFALAGVWSLFLLLRRWFDRLPSFAAAWFWGFSPFMALEVFVRGDLAEAAAIWLVPVVLLGLTRLAEKPAGSRLAAASVLIAFFCLIHNLQLVVFTPIVLAWGIWLVKKYKSSWVMVAFCVGGALAAFFFLPAWLEKDQVSLESLTMGYFDFHNHFVGGRQLFFDRGWGRGVSQPGRETDFSLQLGWPHWWPVVLVPFLYGALEKRHRRSLVIISAVWAGAVLLMTRYSVAVWEAVPFMRFFQFPWRFLGLASLATCVLAAFFFQAMAARSTPGRRPLLFFLLILAAVLNFSYFHAGAFRPVDESFLMAQRWASVTDYLPKTVQRLPDFASGWPRLLPSQSVGEVQSFSSWSNHFSSQVTITADEGTIQLPIFDWAGWEVFVDEDLTISGYLYPAEKQANELGLIMVYLPQGQHTVTGWLRPTPLQRAANGVSLGGLVGLWLILFWVGTQEWRTKNR